MSHSLRLVVLVEACYKSPSLSTGDGVDIGVGGSGRQSLTSCCQAEACPKFFLFEHRLVLEAVDGKV